MSEPTTEAGKALLASIRSGVAALFAFELGDETDDVIPNAIREVERQGAQAERRRITAKWRLDHDTNRDKPEHRHPWAWCENARCREARALLSDPEDPGDGGEWP